jgi:D-beta-D-heptose 7-phosphate kinase/D-beta-D-heptose 1-phosphate adenosyltransferase
MADRQSGIHDLRALQDTHVLVVGDVMLDRYVVGDTQRMSPEAPVPVVLETHTRSVLGGAANVAANIVSVGARATLVGRVGDDAAGEEVLSILDSRGIGRCLGQVPGVPTTTKTRVVSGMQQLTRIDREATHPTTSEELSSALVAVDEFLSNSGSRAIILADYAKGFIGTELIRQVIDRATRAGVPVVTDPKSADLSRYAGSTVVKPNLAEARLACPSSVGDTQLTNPSEEIALLASACLHLSGARNVVLSCSADGVAVLGSDCPSLTRLPTKARQVADVSGAGDTLTAVSALGLAAGLDLERAVAIANAAAGAVCEKAGTACLSATELLSLIAEDAPSAVDRPNPKILSNREEASDVGAQYRRDGRRLVMANGCFDLLHAGHVKLLTQARREGDALVVALNTDASVRRLKGAGRPIQSEADRCEIMAALECVDFVVLFDEETPLDLILAVRPSVLVKGDDYDPDSVVGASEIKAWGGKVVIAPRLDGRSTTRLIDRGDSS